tara:strand:- start:1107 stop:2183 length:1077 start_codon:yes stop_codon:yes gene_type:complete
MTIGVVNDTINSKNFGCQLVSNSIRKYLEKIDSISEIKYYAFNRNLKTIKDELDLVIVNGEGSFGHHSNYPEGFTKFQDALSQLFKKDIPVYLVNFTYQSKDFKKHIEFLKKCTKVTVREPLSYLALKSRGVSNVQLFPDFGASYFKFHTPVKKYDIVFGLGSVSKKLGRKSEKYKEYAELINSYSTNYKVAFLEFPANPITDLVAVKQFLNKDVEIIDGNFEDCYNAIHQSKLLVSGRHHATIMALIAQVPFISFDSNMWKTEGNQIFYGPYKHFNFSEDNSKKKDKINFILKRLDEYTKLARTNHIKLKPYFSGHLDCVFNDISDPIQDGVFKEPNIDKDVKEKFSYIKFKDFGFE